MTTRICETHRRPGSPAVARRARVAAELERLPEVVAQPETHASLLDDVLTAIRHLDGAALATRSRHRFPGWNPRDRRVQRLRGWLSGAPG
ncbi:hypothetical protein SAMN04489729_0419 [Amycolatopsis lurida]|uniref:Uncharacterized protein n=1 Tax=Amycolatopsis lurida NRRL 2430 TaxID=1460371 RepID=A0A2P2FYB8_AMYLU|nr:hypothetical protein [Amycolatopsis lurida]KFU81722.1 hypothetical protein BB31_07655 [Amycolatopsis lurida NRRL 2430]SEB33302.1 hypothetical protein SAMN04489729_0419 [Amycolatopsis lurida]